MPEIQIPDNAVKDHTPELNQRDLDTMRNLTKRQKGIREFYLEDRPKYLPKLEDDVCSYMNCGE